MPCIYFLPSFLPLALVGCERLAYMHSLLQSDLPQLSMNIPDDKKPSPDQDIALELCLLAQEASEGTSLRGFQLKAFVATAKKWDYILNWL